MKKRLWKVIKAGFVVLVLVAVAAFAWVRHRMTGPYREYRVSMAVSSAASPAGATGPFEVGAAVRDVTPDLAAYDPWVDKDGDGSFEPKKGDTYTDRNGSGDFEFVWLGGFDSNRPAKGVLDPLWARAIAFRHNGVTLVLAVIDSVGITHENFIRIRVELAQEGLKVDHIQIATTHSHNTPDTLGIWSHHPLLARFDTPYLEKVLAGTKEAIREAVKALEPVRMIAAMDTLPAQGFVRDSRKPEVIDRQLCAMRFVRAGNEQETVATVVSWGNHPEAMGSENSLISSDFPHFLRLGVEKGVPEPNGCRALGGVCLFFPGPVGGLMTPLGLAVPDRDGTRIHKENGLEKTRALGENLAVRAVKALDAASAVTVESPSLAVAAQTLFLPIEGTFRYPMMLGLIHPGWFDGKARTEIGAMRVGDVELLSIPGEIYPEIVDGGVENPDGGDFPGAPVEVPPLRSLMKGRVNMVLNLANDEIGYIVPRTQWDVDAPYTYGLKKAPYGEVNSGGSKIAPEIHAAAKAILEKLHTTAGKR